VFEMETFNRTWTRFCGEFEEAVLELWLGAVTSRKIAAARRFQESIYVDCEGGIDVDTGLATGNGRTYSSVTVRRVCSDHSSNSATNSYEHTVVSPFSIVPTTVRINGHTFNVWSSYDEAAQILTTTSLCAYSHDDESKLLEVIETRKLYGQSTSTILMEVITRVRRSTESNSGRHSAVNRAQTGPRISECQCIQWFCDEQTATPDLVDTVEHCFHSHTRPIFDLKAPVTAEKAVDAQVVLQCLHTHEATAEVQTISQYVVEYEIFDGSSWMVPPQASTQANTLWTYLPKCTYEHVLTQWSVSKHGCTHNPTQCMQTPTLIQASAQSQIFSSLRQAHLYDLVVPNNYCVFREFSFMFIGGRTNTLGWETLTIQSLDNIHTHSTTHVNNRASVHTTTPHEQSSGRDGDHKPARGQLRRRLWVRILVPTEAQSSCEYAVSQPFTTASSNAQVDAVRESGTHTATSVGTHLHSEALVAPMISLCVPGASPIIHRGFMWKRGDVFTRWRKRMFVLRDDCLFYYSVDGATPVQKGVFHLDGAAVLPLKPENCFNRLHGIGLLLRADAPHGDAHAISNVQPVFAKIRYLSAFDQTQQLRWLTLLSKTVTMLTNTHQVAHLNGMNTHNHGHPPVDLFPFIEAEVIYSGDMYLEDSRKERNDWVLCHFELTHKQLRYRSTTHANSTGSHASAHASTRTQSSVHASLKRSSSSRRSFLRENDTPDTDTHAADGTANIEGVFDIVHCAYTDSATDECEFSVQSLTPATDLGVLVEHRNVLRLMAVDEHSKSEWRNAIRMLVAQPEFSTFTDAHNDNDALNDEDGFGLPRTSEQSLGDVQEIESVMSENMRITSANTSVCSQSDDEDNRDDTQANTLENGKRIKKKSQSILKSVRKSFRKAAKSVYLLSPQSLASSSGHSHGADSDNNNGNGSSSKTSDRVNDGADGDGDYDDAREERTEELYQTPNSKKSHRGSDRGSKHSYSDVDVAIVADTDDENVLTQRSLPFTPFTPATPATAKTPTPTLTHTPTLMHTPTPSAATPDSATHVHQQLQEVEHLEHTTSNSSSSSNFYVYGRSSGAYDDDDISELTVSTGMDVGPPEPPSQRTNVLPAIEEVHNDHDPECEEERVVEPLAHNRPSIVDSQTQTQSATAAPHGILKHAHRSPHSRELVLADHIAGIAPNILSIFQKENIRPEKLFRGGTTCYYICLRCSVSL
jgi:hypothetical protein